MLERLYADLVAMHLQLQKLAGDRRGREVVKLLRRVAELEDRLADTPARTPADAAIKLRLLRVELGDDLTPRQRRLLNDALVALESDGARNVAAEAKKTDGGTSAPFDSARTWTAEDWTADDGAEARVETRR